MLTRLDEFSSPKYKDPWLSRGENEIGAQRFLRTAARRSV